MAAPQIDRASVTFAQAEGVQELPRQLQTKEISTELRAILWFAINECMKGTLDSDQSRFGGNWINDPWMGILRDYWVFDQHLFIDDFRTDPTFWMEFLSNIFKKGDYIAVFGFVQHVIRHPKRPESFEAAVRMALERARAAYRLEDNTIVPFALPEGSGNIDRAFRDMAEPGFMTARAFLGASGDLLTAGRWTEAVQQAICAVQSVVDVVAPRTRTLNAALSQVGNAGYLNPKLKRAMSMLYDYELGEDGVPRAALLDDGGIDEADAFYLFDSCASFVSFMIAKNRLSPQIPMALSAKSEVH